jgi:serine phosphatase RsbU (regulator of sigma subunit)/PAS domain-containing protein
VHEVPAPERPSSSVLGSDRALAFVADAGAVLSSSLDLGETLERVARLCVPELADWCAVYIAGTAGPETEITSGHDDPEVEAMLRDMRRRRRQRAGASESQRVAESARPILVHDARDTPSEDVDGRWEEALARLGARSYIIVPLTARGRTIGSLTLLSTREGRLYTEADLALAQTLASRCAVAIDNAHLHEAAERSLRLLDAVFATAPVGLAFLDPDLRVVRVNRAMEGFTGARELADGLEGAARRTLEEDRPVEDVRLRAGSRAGSEPRHFSLSCAPVRGPGGDVLGVSVVVLDVTERERSLEAERDARIRADFLARAGALLDERLDYEATLRAVAGIAVPDVADWCGVTVLDELGAPRQVTTAHVDPERRRLGEELNRRYPPDPASTTGTMGVIRSGATAYVPEITDEMLVEAIDDPEQLELVRRLDLRSIIIAPLRARARTFGALTLANSSASRRFAAPDVQLAEDLALRAATSIDNARLYTERSRIADTLQAKLLPRRLPDIPGLLLAARYRAAGELNDVGGDFYDVYPCADGWAIVVGDVAGKGSEAAALTALARYTLRAGAADDADPAAALRRLNAAMASEEGMEGLATAALGHLSGVGAGTVSVALALAGHPPGLIVRRDGRVEPAGAPGPMLAVVAEPAYRASGHELAGGDVLVLYTDGVSEAGPRDQPFGEAGLLELLGSLAGRTPTEIVTAVERAVLAVDGGRPRDDLAVLALGPR